MSPAGARSESGVGGSQCAGNGSTTKGGRLAVAIDGPGGVGKSTLARLLAREIGASYIDTGAMYRALALAAVDSGVDLEDEAALERFCAAAMVEYDPETGKVTVNGNDYTGRIRSEEAGSAASRASSKAPVRNLLTGLQRKLASRGRVVMEGRDIGTVVVPDANIKFFFDAPASVRAERRHGEVSGRDVERVAAELEERDSRDSTRKNAPLKKAEDAVYVDTGQLTIEEVLRFLLETMAERGLIQKRT